MKSKRAQEAAVAAEAKPAEIHDDASPPTKKRKRGDDAVEDTRKKEKKDKKKKKGEKESRKEKKEKRKDLQDLPGEDDEEPETANGEVSEAAAPAAEEKKKEKKEKKDKKAKKEKKEEEEEEDKTEEPPKKKSKKEKKKKTSSDETTTSVAPEDAIPDGASNGIDLDVDAGTADANGDAAEGGKAEKSARHIVFVGNLPYTATAASISAHFASLSPIAVRCLTNKGDTKHTCKGIAFVEFANVWTQRTCLERFHHSTFDDGQSAARKINVELTAGGGGTSDNRTEKIREKNRKLDENRAKRIEKEHTAKVAVGSGTKEEQEEHMDEQIHPSRRAQMGSDAPPEDDFHNGGGGGGRRGGWGGRGRGGGGGRGRGGRGGGGRGGGGSRNRGGRKR